MLDPALSPRMPLALAIRSFLSTKSYPLACGYLCEQTRFLTNLFSFCNVRSVIGYFQKGWAHQQIKDLAHFAAAGSPYFSQVLDLHSPNHNVHNCTVLVEVAAHRTCRLGKAVQERMPRLMP